MIRIVELGTETKWGYAEYVARCSTEVFHGRVQFRIRRGIGGTEIEILDPLGGQNEEMLSIIRKDLEAELRRNSVI